MDYTMYVRQGLPVNELLLARSDGKNAHSFIRTTLGIRRQPDLSLTNRNAQHLSEDESRQYMYAQVPGLTPFLCGRPSEAYSNIQKNGNDI